MRALALVLLCAAAGCGARALELAFTLDPGCGVAVPAGGSLLYELVSAGRDGGDPPRVCGACLPVDRALSSADALVAFLRAQAPACNIAHDASISARLTSFAGPGCAAASAGDPAQRLCATSAAVAVGDGRGDQRSTVRLACAAGCDTTACMPLSCVAQGKDCGEILNGCGATIACGECKPPQKCGGGGVEHVCGK